MLADLLHWRETFQDRNNRTLTSQDLVEDTEAKTLTMKLREMRETVLNLSHSIFTLLLLHYLF